MSVAFPRENSMGESLVTPQDNRTTKVNWERHNNQIDTLERRDLYLLDFLSKFDALPIGSVMPTTIAYTSDKMPNGWIWANGGHYKCTGDKTDPLVKENLWNAIVGTDNLITIDDYRAMYGPDTTPDGSRPCGYYVTSRDGWFYVPTLNNVYLRAITADDPEWSSGQHKEDSIKEHTHDIKAYPVNGADLTTNKQIGVALTDEIAEDFTSSATGHKDGHVFESMNNNNSGNETRPKTIAYRFMIKADLTTFDPADSVDADCGSVRGYTPSLIAPDSDNISERLFPVSNPETGKLDSSWIDFSSIAGMLLNDESTMAGIENLVSTSAVHQSEVSEEAEANKIPRANDQGKIDPSYFNVATNSDIEALI